RELKARRAAERIAQPRRRTEIVAQTTVHEETTRVARRNAVLEIREGVVEERTEAVGRVVLRVAVVAEVDTELVAMLGVETDPRQLVLQLAAERVRVARQLCTSAELETGHAGRPVGER